MRVSAILCAAAIAVWAVCPAIAEDAKDGEEAAEEVKKEQVKPEKTETAGAETENAETENAEKAEASQVEEKEESPSVAAEQSGDVDVARGLICQGVENREPVGAADTFDVSTGTIYCFTHIKGVQDTAEIHHRWKRGDAVVSDVTLSVRSPSWRTYSSKTLTEGMAGKWRVDIVLGADKKVLDTIEFTVR